MKNEELERACDVINNSTNLARRVMFDMSDGSVWVDVFASLNSWNEYHDSDIIEVCSLRAYEDSCDEDDPDFYEYEESDIKYWIEQTLQDNGYDNGEISDLMYA
jgi:hypothetical protein